MKRHVKGLFSLSPLIAFLVIYLGGSVILGDFYKIPITIAFLLAAIASVIISRGNLSDRIYKFSQGASDKNIMLMIWIFIMAGAFAQSARAIGSVDTTVALTLQFMPHNLLWVGLFIAACFISLSIGTSVGTVVALVPIAAGLAEQTGNSVAFVTAIVVGGAFFGDNLSFISDTTIAATQLLGCKMSDKFKANITIVLPAALIACVIYIIIGFSENFSYENQISGIDIIKVLPYLSVIILSLCGLNVLLVLLIGIVLSSIVGLATSSVDIWQLISSMGDGIGGMSELIIVTLLAGGMLQLIRIGGGIGYIISLFDYKTKSQKGAELEISGLVSLCNLCTANNTIAIITAAPIAKDMSEKYALDNRRVASLLDTFSCFVQGIIPYGAQMLMASSLAAISPIEIIGNLYYPYLVGFFGLLSILFYPAYRKTKM